MQSRTWSPSYSIFAIFYPTLPSFLTQLGNPSSTFHDGLCPSDQDENAISRCMLLTIAPQETQPLESGQDSLLASKHTPFYFIKYRVDGKLLRNVLRVFRTVHFLLIFSDFAPPQTFSFLSYYYYLSLLYNKHEDDTYRYCGVRKGFKDHVFLLMAGRLHIRQQNL